MGIIRVYADTSVFGGLFDEEFKVPSQRFFDQVRNGGFVLVTSAIVQDEIVLAPPEVRNFGSSQIDVTARQNSQAVIPDLIRNPAFLNPLTALDSGYKHAGMTVGPFWQDWRFVTLIRDEAEFL